MGRTQQHEESVGPERAPHAHDLAVARVAGCGGCWRRLRRERRVHTGAAACE